MTVSSNVRHFNYSGQVQVLLLVEGQPAKTTQYDTDLLHLGPSPGAERPALGWPHRPLAFPFVVRREESKELESWLWAYGIRIPFVTTDHGTQRHSCTPSVRTSLTV